MLAIERYSWIKFALSVYTLNTCGFWGLLVPRKSARKRLVCWRYLGYIYRDPLRDLPMDVLLGDTQADSMLSSKRKLLGLNMEVLGAKFVSFSQCAQASPVFIVNRINRAVDPTWSHLNLVYTLRS